MTETEMTHKASSEAEAAVEAVVETFKNSPKFWSMVDPERRPAWNGVPGIYLAAVTVATSEGGPLTPDPGEVVPMSVTVRPFARHGGHNAILADTDQAAVTAILNFLIHQGIRAARERLSSTDPRDPEGETRQVSGGP